MSSEIKTTYYDNGQIKQRGSNKKHELWFSNGQLSGESHLTEFGRYINEWYESGQRKSESFYPTPLHEKMKQSPHEYHYTWYEDGEKHREYLYNNINIYWHKNGQKKYESVSAEGCVVETRWYENGTKEELKKTCENELDFLNETFHSNGKILSRSIKVAKNPNPGSWQKIEIQTEWWDADGNRTNGPVRLNIDIRDTMDGKSRTGY
jgi:antitoxin component YwqK of YwqJK toxin-antitoxin module